MEPRSTPEKLAFRFVYAIGLLRGAERVCENANPVDMAALPVFLLLGFVLENAFASYLIAHEHKDQAEYKSHDLMRAMNAAKKYGLILGKDAVEFVNEQTPLQKHFVFRYPEKMETVNLPPVKTACKLVRAIMVDIDTVLRMKGIKLDDIAEGL